MANIKKVKNKKGITYQVDIRIKGYKRVIKTFSNKDDALHFAQKTEVAMKEGVYRQSSFMTEDGLKIETLRQLITFFRKKVSPRRYKHSEKYEVMYDWWENQLGDIQLKKLSTSMITQCKNILENEKFKKGNKLVVRQANTINKYLMCLSAVLRYATKDLELISINPMSNVTTEVKPEGRKRFLSEVELQKLFTACKSDSELIYVFFLISLTTGARYSEVLNLSIKDFDFKNAQVSYKDTKNKTSRGVPLPQNVLLVISDYIKNNDIKDKLFINKKTGKLVYVRGKLQKIIKNIGLEDFHIHDIRHTTASYIAMNGGSLLDIAEILGHKSIVMADRYSHLTKKHTAKLINSTSNLMLSQEL